MCIHSRIPFSRTVKGNENWFEESGGSRSRWYNFREVYSREAKLVPELESSRNWDSTIIPFIHRCKYSSIPFFSNLQGKRRLVQEIGGRNTEEFIQGKRKLV